MAARRSGRSLRAWSGEGLSGQADTDRPQALVEGVHRVADDLALRVPVLGDVPRVRRVEGAGDERKALENGALDQRREALRVLADRVTQHLDAEVHVA